MKTTPHDTGIGPSRLEAFSDGVLAIVITIMVLEMKVPHTSSIEGVLGVIPIFFSYLLSFVYLCVYWINHHHMLKVTHHVDAGALWANMHFLFWLSLIPFASGWLGENELAPAPTALYGVVLLMAGVAYWLLKKRLLELHGQDSDLACSVGSHRKLAYSAGAFVAGIGLSFISPPVAVGIYIIVAIAWLVPSQRVAHILTSKANEQKPNSGPVG